MSELISGKDALIALANGIDVECKNNQLNDWGFISDDAPISLFTTGKNRNGYYFEFRLKPRTITLNGVELGHCVSIGICRIKNEISIQFKDESDAEKLHDLLAELYGFRG